MSEEIKDGMHIDDYGNKVWYNNGKLHRIDGPAVEWSYGTKQWIKNDVLHRIGGPAMEYSKGGKIWMLYGIRYYESGYNDLVSNIPLLYWNRFKQGEWI